MLETAIVRAEIAERGLAEAKKVLRGIEWIEDQEYMVWFCPKCNSDRPEHADGCVLAKVLGKGENDSAK